LFPSYSCHQSLPPQELIRNLRAGRASTRFGQIYPRGGATGFSPQAGQLQAIHSRHLKVKQRQRDARYFTLHWMLTENDLEAVDHVLFFIFFL
jgi:hypothetical protein